MKGFWGFYFPEVPLSQYLLYVCCRLCQQTHQHPMPSGLIRGSQLFAVACGWEPEPFCHRDPTDVHEDTRFCLSLGSSLSLEDENSPQGAYHQLQANSNPDTAYGCWSWGVHPMCVPACLLPVLCPWYYSRASPYFWEKMEVNPATALLMAPSKELFFSSKLSIFKDFSNKCLQILSPFVRRLVWENAELIWRLQPGFAVSYAIAGINFKALL